MRDLLKTIFPDFAFYYKASIFGKIFMLSSMYIILLLGVLNYRIFAYGYGSVIVYLVGALIALYDIIYIASIRKVDNISLPRALVLFCLHLTVALILDYIVTDIHTYFIGYQRTDILGQPIGDVLYGWDAVKCNWFGLYAIFRWFGLFMSLVYRGCYICINFFINSIRNKKANKMS